AVGITLVTAILTYLLERNHYLKDESVLSSISMVLYQAVDRTAGFNTMDTGQLQVPTLLLFCVTMFIGSGSASTGGGLRTSTFAVLFLAGFSILRGKRRVEVFKNTIPQDMISKAFTLFLFTIVFEVIMLFLLTITDPDKELIALIFEVVSALGTMGRSTGITADLSPTGTYLIIACMFIGRISTISLLAALSEKGAGARYKYPPAQFMIG
ncbi:MAG: TrkH family potassium uptake protein, partial [Bacteroidia bacterium]|nr:TrkH family potassium uptake protein [Bacteroidia bacterium]